MGSGVGKVIEFGVSQVAVAIGGFDVEGGGIYLQGGEVTGNAVAGMFQALNGAFKLFFGIDNTHSGTDGGGVTFHAVRVMAEDGGDALPAILDYLG